MSQIKQRKSCFSEFFFLGLISIIAGTVLILILKIVQELTGNTAYVLLFNFDYIPVVNSLQSVPFSGSVFHYVTCFLSVIALYYFLKRFGLQRRYWPYIIVYTIGGGALFFLTGLSPQPPAVDDWTAWMYWTFAHGIYGFVVALLIRVWLTSEAGAKSKKQDEKRKIVVVAQQLDSPRRYNKKN